MSAAGVSLGLNAALFMRARPVAGVTTAAAAAAAVVVAARCGRVRLAGRVAPWRVQQARRKSSFAPRVGKAVEPSVQWDGSKVADRTDRGETPEDVEEAEAEAEEEEEDKHLAPSKTTPNTPPQTKSIVKLVENQDQDPSVEEELVEEEEEEEEAGPRSHKLDPQIPIEEAAGKTSSSPGPSTTTTTSPKDWEGDVGALDQSTRQLRDAAKHSGPLEAVLQMESPQQVARQHPAMSPPPYTHHFDTYSLVKQLQDGGYSANQAVEAMKGIRALLAQNLDMAQESLVSKSDVENVQSTPPLFLCGHIVGLLTRYVCVCVCAF